MSRQRQLPTPINHGKTAPLSRQGELRGAALIIVLAFLIIITGLVVAFLSSITNETAGSKATADASTTRTLADSTIQLAIAQIRDATAGFVRDSNGALVTASNVTWASQPGAIRTYDTRASNVAVYKLYSSTNMVDRSGSYNPTNDLPAATNWFTTASAGGALGIWVDLNEPVVARGVTNYPIMDPAMTNRTNGFTIIDGFSIATNSIAIRSTPNRAAMPVRWLYVLRDGSITAPSGGQGGRVDFTNLPSNLTPSSNNPIVARIAFWTDDETCKLNLNTASEGSFWGVPYYSTSFDVAMAQYPPSAREYNRYPGHPASTCLSPVLWSYLGLTNPSIQLSSFPNIPYYAAGSAGFNDYYNAAYGFVTPFLSSNSAAYYSNVLSRVSPRYAWGGSLAGSKTLLVGYNTNVGTSLGLTNLNSSRLFSSIDEFFFSATNSLVTNRVSNGLSISQQDVSRLRFFLTANSRAPEVNPQNLPKICMWPEPSTNNRMAANPSSISASDTRTLYDQTIAYCSTLGTNPYFITRYDAGSCTNDFTARNGILYSYLRASLGLTIPGFSGGTFTSASGSAKWSSLRTDQITTMIFDYIRSCINIADSSGAQYNSAGNITNTNSLRFSYTTPFLTNGNIATGTGQVAPLLVTNGTRGIGRIPTLRGAALLFMARAADQPPLMLNPDRRPRVFDSTGTEISSWDGTRTTISPSNLTNIVMKGNAYALVNPMHPWTCPPMGATEGANDANNFIIGGKKGILLTTASITNSMFQKTNILIPQLCVGDSNYPVLADSAPLNTNKILSDTSDTNAGALFPIFDLSATNTGMLIQDGSGQVANKIAPLTKSFPCLEDEPGKTASQKEASFLSYFWVTARITSTNISYPTASNTTATDQLPYFSATNMTRRRVNRNFSTFTNSIASNVITHTGLPYLSVPNASNGRFDLTNANFIDGNQTNLALYQTRMEAIYLPDLVNVSPGQIGIEPNIRLVVDTSDLSGLMVNGINMIFPSLSGANANYTRYGKFGVESEGKYLYSLGLQYLMGNNGGNTNIPNSATVIQSYTINGSGASQLLANGQTFSFSGGGNGIRHTIYGTNANITIQTARLVFPDASFATPMLPCAPFRDSDRTNNANDNVNSCKFFPPDRAVYIQYLTNAPYKIATASRCTPWDRLTAENGRSAFQEFFNFPSYMNCADTTNSSAAGVSYNQFPDDSYAWYTNGMNRITADTIQAVELKYGDPRLIACLSNIPSSAYSPNPNYGNTTQYTILGWPVYLRNAHSMRSGKMPLNGGMYGSFLSVTNNAGGWSNSYHYPPMVRNASSNTLTLYVPPSAKMMGPITFDPTTPFANPNNFCGYTLPRMWLSFNTTDGQSSYPYAASDCAFNDTNGPFFAIWSKGGDFDNGYAATPDGPMINKADEGIGATNDPTFGSTPYFTVYTPNPPGSNTFSPNRMVASPVIFGSLPELDNNWDPSSTSSIASTITNSSWQTLQFSPNPNALDSSYLARRTAVSGYSEAGSVPTNSILPDHLLLDYFWMPVVEPYPISEPFSTAGKVNMNYAIAPFSYIKRDAAVRGVLEPVMISAVDDCWSYDYKLRHLVRFEDKDACLFSDPNLQQNPAGTTNSISYNQFGSNSGQFYFHYPIHLNETLQQFDYRFTNAGSGQGDLFRSPSEICSLWLYPATQPTTNNPSASTNALTNWDAANANIKAWWYDNPGTTRKGLTGDNVRERPYNYLYPRLTTKSNTYQIHYRVQLLKQSPSAFSTSSTPRSRDFSPSAGWSVFVDPSNTTANRNIKDQITGELRGSATIERYIDPSDTSIPDFAGMISSNTNNFTNPACIMDTYYKFRVFNFKVFAP